MLLMVSANRQQGNRKNESSCFSHAYQNVPGHEVRVPGKERWYVLRVVLIGWVGWLVSWLVC